VEQASRSTSEQQGDGDPEHNASYSEPDSPEEADLEGGPCADSDPIVRLSCPDLDLWIPSHETGHCDPRRCGSVTGNPGFGRRGLYGHPLLTIPSVLQVLRSLAVVHYLAHSRILGRSGAGRLSRL
jgi:hypothetical protein